MRAAITCKKLLPTGQRRVVSGKVELFDGIAQMVHPDHILRTDEAESLPQYEPVHALCAGVSQKLMGRAIAGALDRVPVLAEWVDPALKAQKGWPDWAEAVRAAQAPQGLADLALDAPARARLAYDEVFAHQMTLALARARARRQTGARNARGPARCRPVFWPACLMRQPGHRPAHLVRLPPIWPARAA